MEWLNQILANPAVQTAIASAVGTLVALACAKGGSWLKALVLKTENKLDDALLAALLEALKKQK